MAEIRTDQIHRMCGVTLSVVVCYRERIPRNVAGHDMWSHAMECHADGEAPTPGANVEGPARAEGGGRRNGIFY